MSAAAKALEFSDVRTFARTLEGVDEGTAYGTPCLRLNKTMIACIAINKQAEPNSLMIRLTFDQRDELIAEQPDVYYLKPHYEPYPCVLVRLSRVHRDALKDLLQTAWRLAAARTAKRPARRPTPRTRQPGARTR